MLRVAPWAHPWDALCLLAVWPWADVEGICPFWPRIGLSDPLRPQHPHPEGAADVWHVCYLQAEADAPSDTTTHCSQRETSRPPTWRVSSSGGVIKSVKHINLRPQKGQDYHVAFNPRGLLRCDKNERGIKKSIAGEEGEEKKKTGRNDETMRAIRAWAKLRLWSEATHFAWLLLLSFWSWASRHKKQQQLGISLPPTHTPTSPA